MQKEYKEMFCNVVIDVSAPGAIITKMVANTLLIAESKAELEKQIKELSTRFYIVSADFIS